jgi:hypothetical protein
VNPQEVINLLSIAAAFDNRKAGEANVHAWTDSAQRARWTFAEAAEALKDYYATTQDEKPWVMPSHITARIKAVRQDQALRQTGRELTQAAADPRALTAATQLARRLELPEQFRPTENRALRVRCPHCGSAPNSPCTRSAMGGPRDRSPHPSRIELAEKGDVA